MITCQRCQTENLDGSQYCDECGAALSGQSPQGAKRPGADDGAPVTAPATESSNFDAPAPTPERSRGTVETPLVTSSQFVAPARASAGGQAGPAHKVEELAPPRKVEDSATRRGSSGTPHAKLSRDSPLL